MAFSIPKGTIFASCLLIGGYILLPVLGNLEPFEFDEPLSTTLPMEEIIPANRDDYNRLARMRLKNEAMEALLQGQKGFLETVEHFLWINEQDSRSMYYVRKHFSGRCDRERVGRQILSFAEFRHLENPTTTPRTKLDALRAEFNRTNWGQFPD